MSGPIVRIATGLLKGGIKKTFAGKPFFSFEGVPFGEAPIGSLRYKAPRLAKPWTGTRDALTQSPHNISQDFSIEEKENGEKKLVFAVAGSEDCLHLNVFTPSLPKSNEKPKPVIVFIHGGAYDVGGTKKYTGEIMLDEDIVLVSIPYRLGPLGFLSIGDPSLGVTGNAGLKDMVLALKWVQKNIEAFNGDPNNVTVFGHSSGGSSIGLLMQSPQTKGLFHKAIIQAGSPLCPWTRGSKETGLKLARCLGCEATNEKDILKFLQDISAVKLIEGYVSTYEPALPTRLMDFAPVVEHPDSKDGIVTVEPIDNMVSGKFNHVPTIFGYNSDEGGVFNLEGLNHYDPTSEGRILPHWFKLEVGSEEFKKTERKIREFYLKEGPLTMGENRLSDAGSKLVGDIYFTRALIQNAKLHAKVSSKPVYLYRFSAKTALSYFTRGKTMGPCHGDELGYLFPFSKKMKVEPGSIEDISRRRFLKLFTNFAKNSNPNSKEARDILPDTWEPLEYDKMKILEIGENASMKQLPELDRMKFWDEIYQNFEHTKNY